MNSKDITLWIDERWYDALNRHLKDETLEEHLEKTIDEMCRQLPGQEYERIFLDRLHGKEVTYETEPQYLTGSRTLRAEDISFAEDIIQNDNLLEFYMEVSFHADEVFGTNVCTTENDDWLNIYANYDLERGCVCDTLEVFLQCSNGDELDFKYRLSPEEQALFIPKMNTYCQEHWGQSLEECCTDYLAEQSPASPEMQM